MTLRVDGAAALAAGAAKIEITPSLEVGLLMSSVEGKWAPFVGVRKPLFARILVLEGASAGNPLEPRQRTAIVSLDLLALSGAAFGGFDAFKARIVEAADGVIAAVDVILACTHTHTAPESGAITDLYQTDAFRTWSNYLAVQIGQAVASAAAALEPCTLTYGTAEAPGLGIHRRVKTTSGIMMSHPEPPEDLVLSRDGAVDDSVNVLWFRDRAGELISVLVNATCHPVYEMCNPEVSPDYPGELCARLDETYPEAVSLFLNGPAGNINPRGVSAGAAAAQEHAAQLYAAVQRAHSVADAETDPELALRRRSLKLPTRLPDGEDCGVEIRAEVAALRLGRVALVFLPGEPFVETGAALRKGSQFKWTGVVGFAEQSIGYIPTDEAFAAGGYETGFGPWSILSPGSEFIVRENAAALLKELSPAVAIGVNGAPHLLNRKIRTSDQRVSATGQIGTIEGGDDE